MSSDERDMEQQKADEQHVSDKATDDVSDPLNDDNPLPPASPDRENTDSPLLPSSPVQEAKGAEHVPSVPNPDKPRYRRRKPRHRRRKPKTGESSTQPLPADPNPDTGEGRLCQICYETPPGPSFPQRAPSSKCEHDANVCLACLASSITQQMDQKIWDQIACPVCPERLGFFDVKEFADIATFEKFDRLSLQACLDASSQFQQCCHEGCASGQLYLPEMDSYIICVACSQKMCVQCNIPWHSDATCEEIRVTREARNAQNTASEDFVKAECKLCPKCSSPGRKETGCDHIVCNICQHQYCWGCLADYQKIRDEGNDAHLTECQWRPENLPDVPAEERDVT